MFIILSEKRNERLLIEWSGEISDRHAQDFCDVCNAVFTDHFDLDYMHRKYEANIYGKSFIAIVYKNDKPIGTWGAWRNDLEAKTAFQLCDFATLPEARKGGYILDMSYCIHDEIRRIYPDACTYGYPGKMSAPIAKAGGEAQVTDFYMRIYTGLTEDFQENMPVIDDAYAENFLAKKRNIFVREINGQYYLYKLSKIKRIIPSGIFLGKISSELSVKFKHCKMFKLSMYYSRNKSRLLGEKRVSHSAITYLNLSVNEEGYIAPLYRSDSNSLDFNGKNKH